MLEVKLLGAPMVTRGGAQVSALSGPVIIALLGMLILEAAPQISRQELGRALWPTRDELSRSNNLRVSLHRLRRAWPEADEALDIGRSTVSWRDQSLVRTDLQALHESLAPPTHRARLRVALDLLQGPLLEGCHARWVLRHRRRLQAALLDWLERGLPALRPGPLHELEVMVHARDSPPQDIVGWRHLLAAAADSAPEPEPLEASGESDAGPVSLTSADRALICAALERMARQTLLTGARDEARHALMLAERLAPSRRERATTKEGAGGIPIVLDEGP